MRITIPPVRRLRHFAAVAPLVLLVVACSQATTNAARTRASAACSTSALEVWLGLGEGGVAAGSTYHPLELTNVSRRTCSLSGFPGVSALRERQVGSPAARDRSRAPRTVALAPGETAHTVLQLTNVANYRASRCRPVDARALRVYPPNQRTAKEIPFRFRACSRRGPIFLSVRALARGVGIPGHND